VRVDLLQRQRRAVSKGADKGNHLAQPCVGVPHDRGFGQLREVGEELFDVQRIDLAPADVDGLDGPAVDSMVPSALRLPRSPVRSQPSAVTADAVSASSRR
jgi:hypothetical protein